MKTRRLAIRLMLLAVVAVFLLIPASALASFSWDCPWYKPAAECLFGL